MRCSKQTPTNHKGRLSAHGNDVNEKWGAALDAIR